MATRQKTVHTTMRLPPDLMKKLQAKAQGQRLSRTKLVELILIDYLKRPNSEFRVVVQPTEKPVVDVFA